MNKIKLYFDYLRGDTLVSALAKAAAYQRQGLTTCLAYLPVAKQDWAGVAQEIALYREALDALAQSGLACEITVKPKQFGLATNYAWAKRAISEIAAQAQPLRHNLIWIDMEMPELVAPTLQLFEELRPRYTNIAICLQSYLSRTAADLQRLSRYDNPVRLVKGFYKAKDFRNWSAVTANFARLLAGFSPNCRRAAIATHDEALIAYAKKLIRQKKIANAEFQFFAGLRDDLARALVAEGFAVRLYLPFGPVWPYIRDGVATFDKWRYLQRVLGVKELR